MKKNKIVLCAVLGGVVLCAVLSVIVCFCLPRGESGKSDDTTKETVTYSESGKNDDTTKETVTYSESGKNDDTTKYTVTYSGTSMEPEEYEEGCSLPAPADPVKDNYIFLGWYSDSAFSRKTEFPITVNEDITLYAKFQDNKSAFAEARKNTVGDSSSYEYNYTIDAVATVSDITITGKTAGNAKVNKKSDVNLYDAHTNSGLLFYDGSQYSIRKKTDLTTISFNENEKLRKIEKTVADENQSSVFTTFAKALFQYEDSDLKSVEKTNVAGVYELKTAKNFSSTLELLSTVLNNKIVISLLKNVPENNVESEMLVSFSNGDIETYEYDITISVSSISFTLKYCLSFKNVNKLSDIVTKTFDGISITDSQIDAAKKELTQKINDYKNQAASSYDFKVKTGVDYGTTNAINVTVNGSAKRRILNGEVFFHNIVDVSSDLKNGDLYKEKGLKDIKTIRSRLANKDVYDFEKKTFSTDEFKVENYNDNNRDSYYLLDATDNIATPSFIQKITEKNVITYCVGITEQGTMKLLEWLNANLNLDPLGRATAEIFAFGSMNENSLKVDETVLEVSFENNALKSIEISSEGNVEVSYPLSRDFTQAKPADYEFSVKIKTTADGESYNPYETVKEAKKDN